MRIEMGLIKIEDPRGARLRVHASLQPGELKRLDRSRETMQ
jgi:hypothetical protein